MLGASELEAVAADTAAGEIGRASKHALPLGTPCRNCETPLAGPWCHECGQKGEAYQRSIWHLVGEAFEGLTHFDSRFWNTLPRLARDPGGLTRDYLMGKRASQIPPFRLFLIVLLLLFFVGGLNLGGGGGENKVNVGTIDDPEVQQQLKASGVNVTGNGLQTGGVTVPQPHGHRYEIGGAWLKAQARKAKQNPEAFKFALEEWGHRFAILMLPIAALMLSVLFLGKRDLYVFDHLIFTMHSLSFQGLLLSLFLPLSALSGWADWLLLAMPVHLFAHMRGTYRTSIFGTLARMFLLFIGSTIAFALLMTGLVLVGLASVH